MAVKVYKPITPGLRGMTGYGFEEITKSNPERALLVFRKKHSGRIILVVLLFATRAAVTVSISDLSISSVTNFRFLPRWMLLNMIRTGLHGLHSWFMQMVKSATSSHPWA